MMNPNESLSSAEKDTLLLESLLGSGNPNNEQTPAFRFDVVDLKDDDKEECASQILTTEFQKDNINTNIQQDLEFIDSLLGDTNITPNQHVFRFDTALIDSDSEQEEDGDVNPNSIHEKLNEMKDKTIGENVPMRVVNDMTSAYALKVAASSQAATSGDDVDDMFISEEPTEYHNAKVDDNQITITDTNGNATFTVTRDMLARWEEDMKAYLEKGDNDDDF